MIITKGLNFVYIPFVFLLIHTFFNVSNCLDDDEVSNIIIPDVRIPLEKRKFTSHVINDMITSMKPKFRDKNLANLFGNTYPNTLDTTIDFYNSTDTFVITGDIKAMWLRDSTNQLLPYIAFIDQDLKLADLICNAINRQAYSILLDPYANAFNFNSTSGNNDHADDIRVPGMTNGVFEGKYELDSLVSFLKLSHAYWNKLKSSSNSKISKSCFLNNNNKGENDNSFKWLKAVQLVLETIRQQQMGTEEEQNSEEKKLSYKFLRLTQTATDTLMQNGTGVNAKRTGLSKSFFRPSDDAVTFPYSIPSNAMAVVELKNLAKMLKEIYNLKDSLSTIRDDIIEDALLLAGQIDEGIKKHGLINVSGESEKIFAYEVDGYASAYLMDDANVPSLLSLPYLNYISKHEPLYKKTREFVLSTSNPFYFKGTAGDGIGGPHVGPDYIWPMSIIMRIMTSDDDSEILYCLELLKYASAGTGYIHESYWKNDVTNFTRPWFAWANTLFGEMILQIVEERPWLVLKDDFFVKNKNHQRNDDQGSIFSNFISQIRKKF